MTIRTASCSCGSQRLLRSRIRGLRERILKRFTTKRPYRCQQCGRRQWRDARTVPNPDHNWGLTKSEAAFSDPVDVLAIDRELQTSRAIRRTQGVNPSEQLVVVEDADGLRRTS